jgi:SAM-dependent methyltransferase
MNFFESNSAAERYAIGRPYFHPLVMQRIQVLTRTDRFKKAIDVCCGTGLSTRALRDISDSVVGTDLSQEMIDFAPAIDGVSYHCCPAEELPFPAATFDLMTVALAFHWLDRSRFLREAHRILREKGWLVIYQNGHSGTMRGNPAYEQWNKERYLARYPTPPRNHAAFTREDAARFGFDFPTTENYANDVEFSVGELACYLSTQSNMIASIEAGKETAASALAWLAEELTPMFSREKETFPFGGSIWILQRI